MKRTTSFIAALASTALIVAAAGQARADENTLTTGLELGAFVGWHFYSDNNELGQPNTSNADSPESAFTFGGRVGYGFLKLSKILIGAEAELALTPTETRRAGTSLLNIGWRAQAIATYDTGGRIQPFVLLGLGGSTSSSDDTAALGNDTDFVWHGGIGTRIEIASGFGVRLDGRLLLPPSSETGFVTTDWEVLVGLYKTFGKKKTSAAPAEPASPAPLAPPADTDGDGITDDKDKCPNEAEDVDQFEDEDGCPDADNDKDGVPDVSDACPLKAETKNGVDDADGCPETDDDGDGLVGSADKCPNEPEDKDGFEDTDGCPDPDNDKDGVKDADDKCPAKLETMNGYQDADGCPDVLPKKIQKFTGVIKGIRFVTGSARLRRSSSRVLRKVVKLMAEFPALRIAIAGHTDSRGKADMNRTLSQKRAESVKAYLVKKGVAADRLEAKGYGPDKPIGDNKRHSGRAKNRRVEFSPIVGSK